MISPSLLFDFLRVIVLLGRIRISIAIIEVPVVWFQVGRKPLVCVLEVPNHMTYADFCQFCGSFIQHVLEMRIVR